MSSIAISAIVRPSRILDAAVLGMCFGVLAAGLMIASGWTGDVSLPGRLSVACLSTGSVLLALFCHFRSRKSLRIDISGIGQIRLMEHTDGAQAFAGETEDAGNRGWDEFQLADGSVLWSNLLFLQLKSRQGLDKTLRILPDSVSREEFHALVVAIRWIAVQRDSMSDAA